MQRHGLFLGMVLAVLAVLMPAAPSAAAVVHDQIDWLGDTTTEGMSHWDWSIVGSGDYEDHTDICDVPFGPCGPGVTYPSLISSVDDGGSVGANSNGEWSYDVPGGPAAYISSAQFHWLYSSSNPSLGSGEPHPYYKLTGSSGTVDSFMPSTTTAGGDVKTLNGSTSARAFRFGLLSTSAVSPPASRMALMSRFDFSLDDTDTPVADLDPRDIEFEGSDDGLGVSDLIIAELNAQPPSSAPIAGTVDACAGTSTDPCPLETPPGSKITIDPTELDEGETEMLFAVGDPTGKSDAETFDLKVDYSDPEIVDATGTFWGAEGVLTGPLYTLDIEFGDEYSGVKSAVLEFDGDVIASDSRSSCPSGGCSLELDGDFEPDDYGNGIYPVKLTVTDFAGNVLTGEVDFEIDR